MSNIFTVNNRTYTRKFAWIPIKTTPGELLWLCSYYIRPDRNGQGIILSFDDYIKEMSI